MEKYASLCVLSYQRLEFTKKCLESLLNTSMGYNAEILVNDDGSNPEVKDYLFGLLKERKISFLILNGGKNMGVGHSIQNCLRLSSGDYLFKIDNDLLFKPNWLETAIDILDDKTVGCVGLFDYRNYDPNDKRFNIIDQKEKYNIVDDFVSSIYGFRRELWDKYGKELGTDGWHQYVKSQGYNLVISKEDMVENFGFGINSSIYLEKQNDGSIETRTTSNKPLIFN